MAREDPHFRLRLPAELKDKIEAAASASGRSINAEIVGLLTEALERRAAASAERLSQWDDVAKLLEQFENIQKADRAELAEIGQIEGYLQSDAIAMQAALNEDPFRPSAVRPSLTTPGAKSLALAIDHRAWVLSKSIRVLARSARDHEEAATFAFYNRHRIEGDRFSDEILDDFILEVDGLASELHGADFYDAVQQKIADVPQGTRAGYQAALDHLMPRLFKGWPDAWM